MADEHASGGIDILVDGFQDNPVIAWVFEDPATRTDGIRAYMELFASAYGDHGILEIEESGEGAALWAEPDWSHLDADHTAAEVAERGVVPESTVTRRSTLEDVFLRLTGRRLVD